MPDPKPKPSFSPYRKWGMGFHVGLVIFLVLTVVVMVNYISQTYFVRLNASSHPRNPLSPQTVHFVESITNEVKITVYYDKDEPLFSNVMDLLNEYKLLNSKLSLRVVDYLRDPGAARDLQTAYPFLSGPTTRNVIVFDCGGRVRSVDGNALTKYVLEQVPNPEQREYRRKPTAFEGEKAFTSALIAITNPKPLKAYFLRGHGEHEVDSGDKSVGYLKLASLLHQNYVQVEKLSLLGTNLVPMDCNLLVVAGPATAIPEFELEKIDQYLEQGGRMLALFNVLSLSKGETGLERVLAKWNVQVATNVIKDAEHTMSGTDVIVSRFSKHPIVEPLVQMSLHLILPRMVAKKQGPAIPADSAQVEEIAFSGPRSELTGAPGRAPQSYPLAVAVEKGAIKNVITERGTSRIVVVGDSIFLANHQIDSAANRDFAGYAVNWLLDRPHLLEGLGPRPITEYRLAMTPSQLARTQWLLLGVMPGAVLLAGCGVWLRRRR